MTNMAPFCLNIIAISHLQNLSSYDIIYPVYGRKPPAIRDLQLEGGDLTRPPFYHLTYCLDLLNEHIHAIQDIVKEYHNQIIERRLEKRSMRVTLFIVTFSSETITSDHNLPSKKLKMSYVVLLYIFSKHDKFL